MPSRVLKCESCHASKAGDREAKERKALPQASKGAFAYWHQSAVCALRSDLQALALALLGNC
jgi:hypothetical protein